MKLSDMARYFAAERDPVSSTYRGYTFFSSAPPVSGGAELAGKLNLLELFSPPKPYADDAGTLHAMIAAWQLVPSDAQPHRRSGPLADEHRAVHEQGHGAHSLALLRSGEGDQPGDAARRHAELRASRPRRRRASS